MSEANKMVIRRLVEEHWNQRNAALVSDLFAPTVSLRTTDGPLEGLSGAGALLEVYGSAFPDFRVNIQELLADGDRVILQYTFTGTNRGPLGAIPATGRHVDTPPGIAIFRLVDEKVVDGRIVWDKYALLQQLGVISDVSGSVQGAI
jgi:predicted ester cyclase